MKGKSIDLIIVSGLFLAAISTPIVNFFPQFVVIFFWFFLPSIYLILRKKENLTEIALGTIAIGILVVSADLFLADNFAWRTAGQFQPLLGVPNWSLEEATWVFGTILYAIVFYEHFIDQNISRVISKRLWWLLVIAVFAFAIFYRHALSTPETVQMPYAYLYAGIFGIIIPVTYLFIRRRHLLKKILPAALYFFFFSLIMEVQAVRLNKWWFPNHENYIGSITLFGAYIPLEEVIFWMGFYTIIILAYYEIFVDDNK